ncbi:MAG: DUF4340 domain-containing protein [Oscillospiraceae bacterium]|jgi:hypothetical protein|nr:DUF4340 domain-containing protein [Oscillospiraceae bacterium]
MNWENKLHTFKNFVTKRYALIWAILVIILTTFLILNTFERRNISSTAHFKIKVETFERLEVKNENGGYTIENNGGKFRLAAVDVSLFDENKMHEVFDFLRNATINTIPKKEKKKFVENHTLATVNIKSGKKVINFTVLEAAPSGLGYYIKLGNSVYFLLGASDLFSYTKLDFISKKLFGENFAEASAEASNEWTFSNFAANTINVTSLGKENLKILVSNNSNSLISDKFRSELNNLVNLEASSVKSINPTREEQDAFGVFVPSLQITIKHGTLTEKIRVSKPTDGICFVLTADGKRILICQETDFSFLNLNFENPENLKKKYLVECNLNKIKTIIISSKKKNWDLKFSNNLDSVSSTTTEITGSLANWENILNLLKEFTFGKNMNFDLRGLQNLEFRLEIKYESGNIDKYTFYSNGGDKYVVYGEDEKLCFAINDKELTKLINAIIELSKETGEKTERKTVANKPQV